MALINWLKKLSKLGMDGADDLMLYRSVSMINQMSIVANIACLIFDIYYIFSGLYLGLVTTIPSHLSLMLFLYLNYKKKFLLNKILCVFLVHMMITLGIFVVGYESYVFTFYYTVLIVECLFLAAESKKAIFSSAFITAMFLVITFLQSHSWFKGVISFEEHQIAVLQLLSFILSTIIAFISIYSFIKIITDYKVQMHMSEESQIIAAKMADLAALSAGIAHEINNPLSIISLSAQTIKDLQEEKDLSDKDLITFIDRIIANCDRMVKIVQSMRNFSRQSASDDAIWYSLKQMIDDSLILSKDKAYRNKVIIHVGQIHESLEVMVRQEQIIQVIVNLINNACDAVSEQFDRWIKIEMNIQGSRAFISITDSGNGISPEIKEKIMMPFFTTKKLGKGTGLGLSVSSSIIRKHGGHLIIDDKCPNTRFIFDLEARVFPSARQ